MVQSTSHSLAVAVCPDDEGHYFFGYYDKFPWDRSGRWLLGMKADFADRPPTAEDMLTIGVIDTHNGNRWQPLAETRSWCWQQGCMLQWLGRDTSSEIIFNDRVGDRFVARILNIHTGEERQLPRAIYALNRSGTVAISLSYERLQHQRPGYGYEGVTDPYQEVERPVQDGLFAIDIASGNNRLILSLADIAEIEPSPDFSGMMHRVNHAQFGGNEQRFAFLHRYKPTGDKRVGKTRLITVNTDGSEPYVLNDHDMISHYDWIGPDEIVAWSNRHGLGQHYFLFRDRSDEISCIGEEHFDSDGHCSFSPDRRWMLTDTYPDSEEMRTLALYDLHTQKRIDIGRFHSPPVDWQIRCDLHPRWSPCGSKVCIDSAHEGPRRIYVINVSDIVDTSA